MTFLKSSNLQLQTGYSQQTWAVDMLLNRDPIKCSVTVFVRSLAYIYMFIIFLIDVLQSTNLESSYNCWEGLYQAPSLIAWNVVTSRSSDFCNSFFAFFSFDWVSLRARLNNHLRGIELQEKIKEYRKAV